MTEKTSLAPRDWVIAGLTALADGGVDAVRVERLAKVLGTTKGSFYWHFADRPALLEAMLVLWEQEGTTDLIANVSDLDDPAERLRRITAEALIVVMRGLNVARAETAMRGWAAQDPPSGGALPASNPNGSGFVGELAGLGYDAATATRLAKGLTALIGLYSVRPYAPDLADDEALTDLVERVIASAPRR